MACNCKICVQGREFRRIVSQLPPLDQEWMDEFYEEYCNSGLDANVNEAIIDGTWPNADEIIKFAREKSLKERGEIKE